MNFVIKEVSINQIYPSKDNPRKTFDQEKLDALKGSIEDRDLTEPISIRKADNTIIKGHRRYLAEKALGVTRLTVRVYDVGEGRAAEMRLEAEEDLAEREKEDALYERMQSGQYESLPEVYVEDKTVKSPKDLTSSVYPKDITSRVENPLEEIINLGIVFPDVTDVRDYLMKHPDMDDLLIFASNRALELFGETSEISLEVYHDPEVEDEYLILYIRQYKYQRNIKAEIRDLRSQYRNKLIESSGWFLVTTDYKSPSKAHVQRASLF